jgi:hypothetical protein
MKKILYTSLVIFLSFFTFSQSLNSRDFISETFSPNEIVELEKTNQLHFLRQYVEVGMIVQIREEVRGKITEIDAAPLFRTKESISAEVFLADFNSLDFNPLKYAWRPTIERRYYHIKDSQIYITIPSLNDLNL